MRRTIIAATLCVAAAGGLGAAPAALQQVGTVPIPNLVAYWPFDETSGTTAADLSGNNNNGTHQGPVVISTSVPPFPGTGRSLQFSQAGATFVQVPSSTSLRLNGSFTLAAWVFVADAVNQHGIIEKWTQGTAPEGGYILRLNANEYTSFSVIPAAGGITGITSAPRVIPLGAWVHVAGVYNSTGGTMTAYVNGAPDATTASGVAVPGVESAMLRIGRDYGGNGLQGNIDEPRIYNKALTAGEIGVLRTGQAPPTALIAVPGPGTVDLSWTAPAAVAGVTVTYAVKRSTVNGGPYTVVATGVTGTTFSDTGLALGATYYYVVSAVSVLESVDSGQATTTTLNPTPRTAGHEEGLFDDNCACGSTIGTSSPLLGLLALAALPLLRRRRSPLP